MNSGVHFIIDTIIYRSLYEWLVLGRKIVPHKKLFPVVRIRKGDSAGFVLENSDTLIVCFYYDTISGVIK